MNFFLLLLYLILGVLLFTIPGFILSYIIFKKDKKEVNFLERIVIGFTTTLPIIVINFLIAFYIFNVSPNVFIGLYVGISLVFLFFALVKNEIILKKSKFFHKQKKKIVVKKEEKNTETKSKTNEKTEKPNAKKTTSKKPVKKTINKKKTYSKNTKKKN